MKYVFILLIISSNVLLHGQTISGVVFENNSETPVEYVNIGIVGKNVGTVSDQNGKYSLQINPENHNDSLKFSCIGFIPYIVKVSDFIRLSNGNVGLERKSYDITELVVRSKKLKQKTLGITKKGKLNAICYEHNTMASGGSELGILIKNKGKAFIKEININIAEFSFDTVFFRINFYKPLANMEFENILNNPVYVSLSEREIVKNKITVDLRHLNLVIDDDFLVTYENINFERNFTLCFSACSFYKTYGRRTSQGTWEIPFNSGISISVLADVER